jgi:hypothetical protein
LLEVFGGIAEMHFFNNDQFFRQVRIIGVGTDLGFAGGRCRRSRLG